MLEGFECMNTGENYNTVSLVSSACTSWSQSTHTCARSSSWSVLTCSADFSSQLISRASVSSPVNVLQLPSSQRSCKGGVDAYWRMCLEWSSRHTEGVIVLHILPFDPTADHLARWEQSQDSTSVGMADNVYLPEPYILCTACWKWRAVKMRYVLCSCKDMCPPFWSVALLIGRPGPWGAILCTGEHCCKKAQCTNIQAKTIAGSLMQ